ncbi:DUF4336 domain-containing protein [Leptolyngbya sp. FACHB-8]|uniref:DUF4336 domain-containing protein n=1 Tax=unclassified Leptolyngbya TaxID=2650499 RepID=UPI0016834D9C|nr:DUF4336 domain-containing protein [Leptolyngbya sp. FACHB-8]MBD1910479.1 DUF4336 domain-containing protein [Leptolyngbya sp. FACHB-8]
MTDQRDWEWRFWPLLPLYPYGRRRTLRTEILPDRIWTFDQMHGILYAVVPIRMTVIRLDSGGLFVYAPVAPTRECIRLVQELVAQYGEVKYILLPTSSGLEHKIFVGPFARYFPQAQVFVAPRQWSFPFNLPLSWLGFPAQRTQELPTDSSLAPFGREIDYAVLELDLGRGAFVEVAVFHRPSHTLLVTDTVLSVPEEPPAIAQLDPYPLLFHSRDTALEPMEDTEANRRKGWQRISLFAIYFGPSRLEIVGLGQALREAWKAGDRSRKAYFGFYPFRWRPDWPQSFEGLRAGGRPFVAPILQTLIFPQAPKLVHEWVQRVAGWSFERIIAAHFDAPIHATPQQFRQAFAFLEPNALAQTQHSLPEDDLQYVKAIEATLLRLGVATAPRNP